MSDRKSQTNSAASDWSIVFSLKADNGGRTHTVDEIRALATMWSIDRQLRNEPRLVCHWALCESIGPDIAIIHGWSPLNEQDTYDAVKAVAGAVAAVCERTSVNLFIGSKAAVVAASEGVPPGTTLM